MKKTLLMILMCAVVFVVQAQEDERTYTDEELETYATVMVWAENEKENLSNIVSDSVAIWLENEELTNSKYMELSKADKKGTLDEVEATEEELATYQEIQDRIAGKTEKFKETYITKIKEDIGAGLYNNLRKDLKSNDEVAARYEVIYVRLSEESQQAETGGDPDESAETQESESDTTGSK